MLKLLRICLITGLFSSLLVGCQQDENIVNLPKEEFIKHEELADITLDGDFERIYSQMEKEFQQQISLKELKQIGETFNKDVKTYELQSELTYNNELIEYTWINEDHAKGLRAYFNNEDLIVGLQFIPIETYPETDDVFTQADFILPFEDEWFVFWGGANSLVNYHYEDDRQRYAFDFLIMKDNKTFDGDPTKNESYYAFSENYVAPADGKVVKVVNDIEDNEPVGEMNEERPLGNHVIIDHGHDEYSYLAHFKYESITVNEGDEIKQGDVLGLVGNSGHSSEPHIHFHVADSPNATDSQSIRVNLVEYENLIRGDFVNSHK